MDVHDSKKDVKVAESKQENQDENTINHQTANGHENRSSSSVLSTEQEEDGETLSMSFPPRHLQHRYQTAETTQLITTTTKPKTKNFQSGTQFLCSTYVGETAVLSPVWSNTTTVEQDPASSSAEMKEDIREGRERERHKEDRYQESKMETSIPTAQHLPPGANTRIAEKKKKNIPRRGEGKGGNGRGSKDGDDKRSKDDDDDDNDSDRDNNRPDRKHADANEDDRYSRRAYK